MGTDRDAFQELSSVSDVDSPHVVQHYLYFSNIVDGKRVAETLTQRGFTVEDRLGADGVNWLVLAKSRIVLSEEKIAELLSEMETLATENRGEYDGWEAEIPKE